MIIGKREGFVKKRKLFRESKIFFQKRILCIIILNR